MRSEIPKRRHGCFRLPPTQAELTRAFEEQAKETTQVMIEQVVQGSTLPVP